jgi:hypothetical protein
MARRAAASGSSLEDKQWETGMWKSMMAQTVDGAVTLALELARELRQAGRDEAVIPGVRVYTNADRPGEFLFNPAAVEQFMALSCGSLETLADAQEPASLVSYQLRFSTPP